MLKKTVASEMSKERTADLKVYTKLFNLLTNDRFILFHGSNSINSSLNTLLKRHDIDNDIIDAANQYVNGKSNYLTLNRFIEMMQLISLIQNGKKDLLTIQNELKSMEDFIYIEYTFVGDPEYNQLTLPLQIYEIKISQNGSVDLLKEKIKQRHNIPNIDYIHICDIWKYKIHRELPNLRESNVILTDDINRRCDDIFVYHKIKPSVSPSELKIIQTRERRHILDKYRYPVNITRKEMRKRFGFNNGMTEIDVCFSMPFILTVVEGRSQIKMYELYKRLCKMIRPFLNDNSLKEKFDLALNITQSDIHYIIFGYIRMKYEEKLKLIIPTELKLVIMRYIQFMIPKELPFKMMGKWGFNDEQELVDNDEIFDLDVVNLKFEIQWTDDTKLGAKWSDIANRKQVIADSFDESIPYPISVDNFP